MRLFTAIDVPAEVRQKLTELVAGLSPTAPIQWSPAGNWHITTKFIGAWTDEAGMERELATVRVPAFSVEVRGLGWYPNPHQPRVLFAGVAAPDELGDLHEQTDAACARLGIAQETKRYSPHLTLARIRTSVPVMDLRRAISELPAVDFGAFRAESFWLYESRAEAQGSVYRKIKEFPLG
jgi:RNA 2',3'-cyclic 3'-phosphodiesterase